MVCVTPFFTTVSVPVTAVNLMGVPAAADVVLLAPKPEKKIFTINFLYTTKHCLAQNVLSTHILSKNIKIRIYKTWWRRGTCTGKPEGKRPL
jgi:hypothetical protein